MSIRVIRAAELRTVPIGEAGNTTTELSIYPPGATLAGRDYRVRISTAHLQSGGEFSKIFSGYSRILMLLLGHGLKLKIYDLPCDACRAKILKGPGSQCAFSGNVLVKSKLLEGPIRDFNVIYRPGQINSATAVLRCCADRIETFSLVHLLKAEGSLRQVDIFFAFGKYRLIIAGQRTECDCGDVAIIEQAYPAAEHDTLTLERCDNVPVAHAQIVMPAE